MGRKMSGDLPLVPEQIVAECQHGEPGRDTELVQIVFPPVREAGDQGKYGDRPEQQRKGQVHAARRRLELSVRRSGYGLPRRRALVRLRAVTDYRRRSTLRQPRRQARRVDHDQQTDGRQSQSVGGTARGTVFHGLGSFRVAGDDFRVAGAETCRTPARSRARDRRPARPRLAPILARTGKS